MFDHIGRGLALWASRIICTMFFMVMQPLFVGRGRPSWELLSRFESFIMIMIALLVAGCAMAWFWPRVAGWLLLISLPVFHGVMLQETGRLEIWFAALLFAPALLLIWAGANPGRKVKQTL